MSSEIAALQSSAKESSPHDTALADGGDARIRVHIRPHRGWFEFEIRELWQFRELAYFLVWRDVKVRYKQTVLGVLWAALQPVTMMAIFTVVMGRMARVPTTADVPQPIFFFTGVLLWNFFATAITAAANSVVGSNAMVEKVYFPRIIIPFASVGASAVDFAIAFGVLVLMMIGYGIAPGMISVIVPVLLLLTMMAALGVGTLLAALNVRYRDFRHTIPFLVQLWMFATPSIYMDLSTANERASGATAVANISSDERIDDVNDERGAFYKYGSWLELNPMTALIASFRAAVLGTPLPWSSLAYSSTAIVALFVIGTIFFNRAQRSFADVI